MGQRGPAPKPTNLRLLNGNPSNRPVNEQEAEPSVDEETPKPPAWLDNEAKKEWKRIVPELRKVGLLSMVDHPSFAAYCQTYSRFIASEKVLKKEGLTFETPNGYPQQRPEVSISNKALEQMRKYASDFGLSPSSRSRLQIDGGENKEDEFLEFLQRRK